MCASEMVSSGCDFVSVHLCGWLCEYCLISKILQQNRRFAEITFHGGYLYVTDVEEFSVARISANEMLNSNLKQIAAHSYGPSIFYGFRGIMVVAADTDTHSGILIFMYLTQSIATLWQH